MEKSNLGGRPLFILGQLLFFFGLIGSALFWYGFLASGPTWIPIDYFIVSVLPLGWIMLAQATYRLWIFVYQIEVHPGTLHLQNCMFRNQQIAFGDIRQASLQQNQRGFDLRIKFGRGIFKVALISNEFLNFGAIAERILLEGVNIELVDNADNLLSKVANDREIWQKEPDWTIINAAIARAQENRKKKNNSD